MTPPSRLLLAVLLSAAALARADEHDWLRVLGDGAQPIGEGQAPAPAQSPDVKGRAVGGETTTASTGGSVKVAFVGDTGTGTWRRGRAWKGASSPCVPCEMFDMVKREGAQLIVHLGDMGYDSGAERFEGMIEDVIPDLPMIGVLGNHDIERGDDGEGQPQKAEYQAVLQRRLDKISGIDCSYTKKDDTVSTGEIGVIQACTFGGVRFVLSAVPMIGDEDGHAEFIRDRMAEGNAKWRVCAWHKPHSDYQPGHKSDGPNVKVYEACREAGAIVATGHEHGYGRTKLITNYKKKEYSDGAIEIQAGTSLAFVSGAGGRTLRSQGGAAGSNWMPMSQVYMQAQRTAERRANTPDDTDWKKDAGALICTFQGASASCDFKLIDGTVKDSFTMTSKL